MPFNEFDEEVEEEFDEEYEGSQCPNCLVIFDSDDECLNHICEHDVV